MRTSIRLAALAFAAAAVLVSPARAADMAVKASPFAAAAVNPCTPTSCSGLYLGGGLAGNGTNANIIGNGLNNSVFAGGLVPSFNAGYQYAKGNWFFAIEADFADQLSTTSTVNGIGGNQNGPLFMQIFKVGGNLSGLLGTQTPISIPPQLSAALISPYVFVGPAEHLFGSTCATGTASGAGATFDISPNWFVDIRYTNIQYGASKNAALAFDSQNLVGVSFNYKFK